jgi:TctA family transporter
MEEHLRRAMLLSRGDPTLFVNPAEKPISFSFLLAAAVLIAVIALPNIRRKREEVFVEET